MIGFPVWAALALAASSPPVVVAPGPSPSELLDAWRWHNKFRADNAALRASGRRPTIVFIGDSITEEWIVQSPEFFTPDRIDRGISGETSAQMLTRFRADVIDLHPRLVQIMAGTNDIAGVLATISPEETRDNIRSMTELAQSHGIGVIIGSIPPADHFRWRPGVTPAPAIADINRWMRAYAAACGATYADYWQVLHDRQAMRATYTDDGVHPNHAGYEAFSPVADRAIREATIKLRASKNRN